MPGARDIPAVSSVLDDVLSKASKLTWEMPQDLPRCEVRFDNGLTCYCNWFLVSNKSRITLVLTKFWVASVTFKRRRCLIDKGCRRNDLV